MDNELKLRILSLEYQNEQLVRIVQSLGASIAHLTNSGFILLDRIENLEKILNARRSIVDAPFSEN